MVADQIETSRLQTPLQIRDDHLKLSASLRSFTCSKASSLATNAALNTHHPSL